MGPREAVAPGGQGSRGLTWKAGGRPASSWPAAAGTGRGCLSAPSSTGCPRERQAATPASWARVEGMDGPQGLRPGCHTCARSLHPPMSWLLGPLAQLLHGPHQQLPPRGAHHSLVIPKFGPHPQPAPDGEGHGTLQRQSVGHHHGRGQTHGQHVGESGQQVLRLHTGLQQGWGVRGRKEVVGRSRSRMQSPGPPCTSVPPPARRPLTRRRAHPR